MTRRFEFIAGTSAKFWEITQAGKDVTVRYGRLGTDGQSLTKSFPTFDATARYAEKLVAQKQAKGYVECAAV